MLPVETVLPESFKMTEIGPLPEEWQVVRLENVVSLGNEAVNPTHVAAGRYVGLEHIEPGSTRIQKWGHPSEVRSLKTAFRPGDVLYGKLRPYLDKAALAEWEGICSTDILVLRAQNGLEPDFLAYLAHTRTFLEYAIATMTGVNHPRTSWKALQQLQVPLPPLPEQRAIAHVLRTVQRAKEATEGVIGALKELKKSVMRHLFTYGPVPVNQADQVPVKETELSPVPEEWELIRLGEVALQAFGGGTPSTNNSLFWGGPIPWTTSAIIGEDDVELRNFQRTISEKGLKRSSLAPKGSLLIGTRVGVGKAVVAAFDIAINQDLTAIVLHEKANPYYVAFLLKDYRYQVWLTGRTRGTTIKGIPRRDLLNVPIPLPPLPEQQAIAETMRTVERKIEVEKGRKRALEALFKTLLHHFMTGKVRVKDFHLPELERTP
jgi:type I restriction enzyme S subunit